jgi:hypothetical protein
VGLHRDAMMLWLKVRLLRGPERTRERSTIGTGVRYDW